MRWPWLPPCRVSPSGLAKTNPDERRARLKELIDAPWVRERGVELDGLDQADAGEDDFDALMQAAALVRMVDSKIPLSSHLTDPAWEGGILGTGGLLQEPPRVRSGPAGTRTTRPRNGSRGGSPKKCPIDGCEKVFRWGRSGWDAHVGSTSLHPDWEPTLVSREQRKSAFRKQFSDWF